MNFNTSTLSVLTALHDDAATVKAIDVALTNTAHVLTFYGELAAAIAARTPVVPEGQRETREEERLRREVDQDLAALDEGIGERELVNDPRLEVLRGHKGRRWWLRAQQRLLQQRAVAVERERTTWPREFRYTGKRFKTEINGRYLEAGDIVSLNAQQAEAFKDRFELVTAESSPAVTA